MGLVVLDCELKFEAADNPRRLDQFFTTGLDKLNKPQAAQIALYCNAEDPDQLSAAQPTRGLLLIGPLVPGTYYLERVGAERDFIETNPRDGLEIVRDPVTCRPGNAGTSRIAFVVEPGDVTYVGRMTAACDLRAPDQPSARLAGIIRRVTWAADDRTWSITWDRNIRHEISAWERMFVSLRTTAWGDPIARRLEFLRSQQP